MKIKYPIILILFFYIFAYAESKNEIRTIEKYSERYVIDKNGIFLYKEPDINSEKIINIPYGTRIESTKIAINELMLYIKWKGYEGWVVDEPTLSFDKPLPIIPKNDSEIIKTLTSGYFYETCGITFKLREDGTGEGSYDYCAGGEPSIVKSLTWKGNNPFYITVVTSTPYGSNSFNSAKGYTDSTTTIIIKYDAFDNVFSTDDIGLKFKYSPKP